MAARACRTFESESSDARNGTNASAADRLVTATARSYLEGIADTSAQVLSATGTAEEWTFELRFPSHEALSAFKDHCERADVPLEVRRVYNPTKPAAGPWYGLTVSQRETLIRAVEGGYYAIPRGISTAELAEEFDISDQAVTERLRRAIQTLVENTLLLAAADDERLETPRR